METAARTPIPEEKIPEQILASIIRRAHGRPWRVLQERPEDWLVLIGRDDVHTFEKPDARDDENRP
jgi:hypothetical protein